MIVYTPLWKTLQQKNISIYKLINIYGFSRGFIDNLKHNRSITMKSLNDLMTKLDIEDITDIIAYVPDEAYNPNSEPPVEL